MAGVGVPGQRSRGPRPGRSAPTAGPRRPTGWGPKRSPETSPGARSLQRLQGTAPPASPGPWWLQASPGLWPLTPVSAAVVTGHSSVSCLQTPSASLSRGRCHSARSRRIASADLGLSDIFCARGTTRSLSREGMKRCSQVSGARAGARLWGAGVPSASRRSCPGV